MMPDSNSQKTYQNINLPNTPDLTKMLDLNTRQVIGVGTSSVIYLCINAEGKEVAVKAISLPLVYTGIAEKNELIQQVRCTFEVWKALEHPNIVPFLGTASGKEFGSDFPCIVSVWMENGTLFEYAKVRGSKLSLPDRLQLVRGSAAGLAYLHSRHAAHGNLHPGSILIDEAHNARLTGFGFSLSLPTMQDPFLYSWQDSIRPSASLWAAPELMYPDLYPSLGNRATLHSDIYSFGSTILYILSGQSPWRGRAEAADKMKTFENPPRPVWPMCVPNGVWSFIEQCWSPRDPESRPSAKEVLSFCEDRLEHLLWPNIDAVVFGAVGSGKSSIINLLAGQQIAQVSLGVKPCTAQSGPYTVSVQGRQFRLWDTVGFSLAQDGPISHLSAYEQAHNVLRNLPNGVSLILLCIDKKTIIPSLRRLYWLINHFFFDGQVPMALVLTHFDTADEEWWERHKRDIAQETNIPIESIPTACISKDPTDCDQSKHALIKLLQTYATASLPIPLRPDLSHSTGTSSNTFSRGTLCKWFGRARVEGIRAMFPLKMLTRSWTRMQKRTTVKSLKHRFGLTNEHAERLMQWLSGRNDDWETSPPRFPALSEPRT